MYPLKTLENPWFSDLWIPVAYSRGMQMDHWPKISKGDASAYGKIHVNKFCSP